MRRVRIQGMNHRRPFLNDANSRVAMTVNPSLMTLGQPKPSFQIEIVLDLFKRPLANEKAGEKTQHHRGHPHPNGISRHLELINQLCEGRRGNQGFGEPDALS